MTTTKPQTIANQQKQFGPVYYEDESLRITATVQHDDSCGNGHNSFSITGDIRRKERGRWVEDSCGCLHEEIAQHFPELAPLLKWHLVSTDEPMHYVANTLYWLGFSGWYNGGPTDPPNLDHARSTAVWPDMPATFLCGDGMTKEQVETALMERLDSVLAEFRAAVESLGFTF